MADRQTTQSARETIARTTKALALVDILAAHGATAAEARALPPSGRRMAEQLAGVRPGSDTTWQVVVTVLEQRDRCGADPFAGLS